MPELRRAAPLLLIHQQVIGARFFRKDDRFGFAPVELSPQRLRGVPVLNRPDFEEIWK